MNMGLAHILNQNFIEAEIETRQAETIFQRFSNITELARVWGNLGVIYFHQDKWLEAHLYLEKSLQIWRNLQRKDGEINTLMDLIELELARGRRQQALEKLKEVKILIEQEQKTGWYNYLQPRFTKYHAELESLQ